MTPCDRSDYSAMVKSVTCEFSQRSWEAWHAGSDWLRWNRAHRPTRRSGFRI